MSVSAGFKRAPRCLTAAFALSLACSGSALALDGKAFVDVLQDGMQPYGLTLKYQNLAVDKDNLTLKNARLLQQNSGDTPSLPIYLGTLGFNQVTAAADGSFNVDSITAGSDSLAEAKKAGSGSDRIIVRDIVISQAHISPKGKIYTIAQYLPYKNVTVKNITYQVDGKTTLSLDDITAQYEQKGAGQFENTSKIASFTYDPAAWPGKEGQDAKAMLNALGYDKIRGNFSAVAVWDPQKGDLDISEYKLVADQLGSLSFSGALSGVTQQFANAYQKLALQQAENKKPDKQQQQQFSRTALALATQLDFNAFTLTYQDNSLAGRILDYMSKTSAVARQEIVSVLKANVLQNTQNFRDTAFANRVAGQINAFLDKPQSLQITARPQKPVAFSAILLALGLSPEQLIDLLSLNVTANQ